MAKNEVQASCIYPSISIIRYLPQVNIHTQNQNRDIVKQDQAENMTGYVRNQTLTVSLFSGPKNEFAFWSSS